MLLHALELIFEQRKHVAKAYLRNEYGLVLYWHHDKGTIAFPARLTADQVLPTVLAYLDDPDGHPELKFEEWDADTEHDGYNRKGWRVYVEDWGHVGGNSYALCAIRPVFLWYGK